MCRISDQVRLGDQVPLFVMASQGADSSVSGQSGSVTTRSVGNQCFSVGQMIFFDSIVVMNPLWGKAPSWLSTPAARSESDSDSDSSSNSNPSPSYDGAPHMSPGPNNDDDDDSGNPKSRIRKVKKRTRKHRSKLNRIRQIASKAKTTVETTHSNKSLKNKHLQKGSHSHNHPANDDDGSESDGWHWVD